MNITFYVRLIVNDLMTASQKYSVITGVHMSICMSKKYVLHHMAEHAV